MRTDTQTVRGHGEEVASAPEQSSAALSVELTHTTPHGLPVGASGPRVSRGAGLHRGEQRAPGHSGFAGVWPPLPLLLRGHYPLPPAGGHSLFCSEGSITLSFRATLQAACEGQMGRREGERQGGW